MWRNAIGIGLVSFAASLVFPDVERGFICTFMTFVVYGVLCTAIWILYKFHKRPKPIDTPNEEYDYIVVGAGSSGSVVANRLSEDPSAKVLVLEAGGSEEWSLPMKIPFFPIFLQKTDYDWGFVTASQKHACQGMNDQKSFWPRGRVLGGSSCLNYMVYVRGSRHDFDDWAANGCDGWSYKDVLPYFIKSENIQIPELMKSDYHGKEGPLHVEPGYVTPLADLYGQALEEIGIKSRDINGEDIFGYSKMQLNTKNGTRCSTVKAFLRPAMSRPNLHVCTNSVVTKVIIENQKAVGVAVIKNGRKYVIRCRKEVILSAGAIGSPHILMLSGVGPKQHLEEHRIKVHADLPVGRNLQDHIMIPLAFFPNERLSISQATLLNPMTPIKYLMFGTGCMRVCGLEGTAFFKTDTSSVAKHPDMQLHFFSVNPPSKETMAEEKTNLTQKMAEILSKGKYQGSRHRFTVFPTLLHPKSRGTITLRSNDPFDHPIIEPHYLSEKEDVDTFVRAIKVVLKMADTSTFKKYDIKNTDPDLDIPSLSEYEYGTDAYWENYVRHLTLTVYHPTSTCSMGNADDSKAVVDPKLRVIGIENLRVADCSVMRTITSGNTNAPAIMIGEKAADLIQGKDSVKHIKQRIHHILTKL